MRNTSKKSKKTTADMRDGRRAEETRERAYDALSHLRVIAEGADLTYLYRKFFPEEFARDNPDYGSANALMNFYDRFSRLVGERLFPVAGFLEYDEAYDEPAYVLSRMHVCMLRNWLFDNRVHFDGMESLHIVEKLVILGSDVWKHLDSTIQTHLWRAVDFRKPSDHEFDMDLLRVACKQEKGMIGRLGLVADAILGGTGNVWLDLGYEEYDMAELPTWTEAEIKFLAKEFVEYRRMSEEIREFFAWCDSPNKIERVKRLLRGFWVRKDGERGRARAQRFGGDPGPFAEALGRPLVETLGGLL